MKTKASPQLIPPFEHQILDNEKRNHEKYIEFRKKANNPIAEVYPEAYLYQIGLGKAGCFASLRLNLVNMRSNSCM